MDSSSQASSMPRFVVKYKCINKKHNLTLLFMYVCFVPAAVSIDTDSMDCETDSSQNTTLSEAAHQLDSFEHAANSTVLNSSVDSAAGEHASKRHCGPSGALDIAGFKELLDRSNDESRQLYERNAAASRMQMDANAEESRRQHNELMSEIKYERDINKQRVERVAEVADDAIRATIRNTDAIGRGDRALDLTIRGVPLIGRETSAMLRAIVIKLGRALGVALDVERLVHVYRVRQRAGQGDEKTPMIIAKFGSIGVRHAFFSAYFDRRELGLSTVDIGFDVRQRIFISDNLTKVNSILRGKATALKRAGRIANFAVRDGIVRIVCREGQMGRAVHTELELEELMADGGSRAQKRLRNDQQSHQAGQGAGMRETAGVAPRSTPFQRSAPAQASASAQELAPSWSSAPSSGALVRVPVGPPSCSTVLTDAVNAMAIQNVQDNA